MQPCRIPPTGARALGRWQKLPRARTRAPGSLSSRIHATKPHPAPQGREPSGNNRYYPKPDPGLFDHCQHESMQPCRIPPHRGASPRGTTDIIPSRTQGSLITASMNPCNHAASRLTGARALGEQQILPQAESRAPKLLPARIQITMPHPAPKGRKFSLKMKDVNFQPEKYSRC